VADIEVTCVQCGNRIVVSEYVAPDALKCAKCGAAVKPPERAPAEPAVHKLKLANPSAHGTAAAEPAAESAAPATEIRPRLRDRRVKRGGLAAAGPWLLFFALAGLLAWVRYSGPLGEPLTGYVVKGALGLLLFLHVVLAVHAFTEDMFHGVLCLVVPGYTLYYLFVFSDIFYMRAVVAALLVAFGVDTYHTVTKIGHKTYVGITHWMQTTGSVAQERVTPK
jgi:hypothetical protein